MPYCRWVEVNADDPQVLSAEFQEGPPRADRGQAVAFSQGDLLLGGGIIEGTCEPVTVGSQLNGERGET